MRKLAVLTFVTFDGVMQAPGSAEEDVSGGFDHGGWAAPCWDGVMPHVERTAMAAPYDILFGRKTYDLFAGHWPTAPKSTTSDRLNTARKYVVTSTPLTSNWQSTQTLAGTDEVIRLKAQDGPLLQVHGSAHLIQSLLADDLIDEFRIWAFPVVVGSGKRLFQGAHPPLTLDCVTTERLANGVVSQVYRKSA